MFFRLRLNLVCLLCLLFACVLGRTVLNSIHSTAHAAGATITLSATVGPPTSTITVNGTGYAPTQKLELRMDMTVQLGSVTTDATGAFSVSIVIPATSLPGHHTLFAASVQPPYISGRAGYLVQSDWPEFGYDAQHTNSNPYENLLSVTNVSQLVLAWSKQTGKTSSVSICNGIAYLATYGDRIYAYNATTGSLLFVIPARNLNHFYGTPAVSNGLLYMGSGDGIFSAYNAETGAEVWSYSSHNGFFSSPNISNNIVYISTGGGILLAFNATTGARMWVQYNKNGFYGAAVSNNIVYASTGSGIFAFNATSGTRIWKSSAGYSAGSPVVANGIVYAGSSTGTIQALNATTGASLWNSQVTSGYMSVSAIANGILYATTTNGTVFALDATTGAPLWTFTSGGNGYSTSPVVANGVLYMSGGNTLYALNATTGASLWGYSNGSMFSSPTVVNGIVYIGSTVSSGYYIDAFHLPNAA